MLSVIYVGQWQKMQYLETCLDLYLYRLQRLPDPMVWTVIESPPNVIWPSDLGM